MSGTPHRDKPEVPGLSSALEKAFAAFNAGALDDATVAARDILRSAPEDDEAWELLALIADRRGRTMDGVTVLRHAIGLLPRSSRLYTALGEFLAKTGPLADAEAAWRYALALQPENERAAANLCGFLIHYGRAAAAQAVLGPLLALAPDRPGYNFQFAKALAAEGRLAEAQAFFAKVAALTKPNANRSTARQASHEPSYLDAITHLGVLQLRQGEVLQAVAHLRDAIALGGTVMVQAQFALGVSVAIFTEQRPDLKPLLIRAFQESWIPPADLVRSAARLLLLEPAFVQSLETIEQEKKNLLSEHCVAAVAADPLLRVMLRTAVVTDPQMERLLAAIRAALLQARIGVDTAQKARLEEFFDFAVALANQCFANEYVFAETPEERDAVSTLKEEIREALLSDAPIPPIDPALIAAYDPLYKTEHAEQIPKRSWPNNLAPLLQRQIREPLDEQQRARTISRITPIVDEISKAVQNQYEENPYPRWLEAPFRALGYSLEDWLGTYLPHVPAAPRNRAEPLEVLVAGCGTGQEAVGAAVRFANAHVLAIDLSLTSLAYAVRKTAELGIANITYAQADILELGGLDRQFDVIESGGVLHHLADPVGGWKTLADLTRPGGYMVLALYSARGRQDLNAASAFAKAGGYGHSAEALRRFRQDVLKLDSDDPVQSIVHTREDFYNLSMLRDLLFHVQEQTFTIPKIAAAVKKLGLQFCGFAPGQDVLRRFQDRFPKASDFPSLAAWETFEMENPAIFSGMYHFIVRKPG